MADKIVAEYIVKTDKAVAELNKIVGRLDSIEKEQKKTQDGFKSMSKGMVDDFKKVGAAIGLAFGTQQLVSFGKEAVKVAAQAEGIRTAFARLNQPNLLNELRKATRGTVNDLTLMQQAVRANNFQVPLERLATFFDFATKRSIETGESVDYLVQSIIDGIGRKSTLVLDNLGISASQLQEEIKKTGDFGEAAANIISQSLEETGVVADTTAIKLARLTAEWENFTKEVGDSLIVLGDFVLKMNDVNGAVSLGQEALQNRVNSTASAAIATAKLSAATGEEIGLLKQVRIQLFGLTDEQEELIRIYEDSQKAKDKNNSSTKEAIGLTSANANSINQLNQELKTLQKDLKDAEIGSAEFFAIVDKITAKTKELNEAVAMTKLADALKVDIEEDIDITGAVIDYPKEVERATGIADEIWKRHFDELMSLQEDFNDSRIENTELTDQEIGDIIANSFQAIAQLSNAISQIIQNNYQSELDALKTRFDEEKITREEYEERKKELQRDAAKSEKSARLFSAILNTAASITSALTIPPPAGPILAGINAALGAVQIGVITSQPLPQFADGGFINQYGELVGKKHREGGITIEAEHGEFITSAKHAQANKDILKAINSGNWEKYKFENIISPAIEQVLDGGFENIGGSIVLNSNWNDKNLLKAIDRHRTSDKNGFEFLANELKKLKQPNRGGYSA